jgi:hypothetical protein
VRPIHHTCPVSLRSAGFPQVGKPFEQHVSKSLPDYREPDPKRAQRLRQSHQGENSLGWSGPEKAPESLQMLVLPLMPP